ncbi:MAG: hypothetical protein E1N59_2168 [Puniceicoccaceae bacterium 5H]|nr:MAG: hypothetical protein E1N59_2168 [Puniceicoccaceae bacterium 5H]
MAKHNAHRWIAEPLLQRADCVERRMFGAEAYYLGGKLVLLTTDGEEPWKGCLFPAERDQHAAILREFTALSEHPQLSKWLYLPQIHPEFEELAQELVQRCLAEDPRFGVIPPPKRKKKQAKKALPDGRPPHLA